MVSSKVKQRAAILILAVGLLPPQSPAQKPPEVAQAQQLSKPPVLTPDKASRATKLDLTPESFPKLHALIGPQENEWRHLRVHWLTDVVAARKKAAAEDKPLVFIHTGGAGYNEPLGIC
jgi:hypothetical protein